MSPSPPSASGDSKAKQAAAPEKAVLVPKEVAPPEVPEAHDEPQEEALSDPEEIHVRAASPSPSHSSVSSQSTHKSSKSKSKKKTKKTCRLRDEQEEGQVLEWVEEHPCLWNLKHKDFKNKAKKERLWEDKANELGYDGKFKLILSLNFIILFIIVILSCTYLQKCLQKFVACFT